GFSGALEHRGLAVGDLDDDGLPEVLVSNSISIFDVYRFWPERVEERLGLDPLSPLESVDGVVIADVDGDGLPDIVALASIDHDKWDQRTVYVAFGTEPLHFTAWSEVAALPKMPRAGLL